MARNYRTRCEKCGQIMVGGRRRLNRHKREVKFWSVQYKDKVNVNNNLADMPCLFRNSLSRRQIVKELLKVEAWGRRIIPYFLFDKLFFMIY